MYVYIHQYWNDLDILRMKCFITKPLHYISFF